MRWLDSERFNDIWLFSDKKGRYPAVKRKHETSPPTHVFVYGRGTIKVKNVVEVSKPEQITGYEDVYNLVSKHGAEATALLLGFDLGSYGNRSIILFLKHFEEQNAKLFLEWLNALAELDEKILEFLNTNKILIHKEYVIKGTEVVSSYKLPFLGYHVATSLFGIMSTSPHIDSISFSDALDLVFNALQLEYEDSSVFDKLEVMDISREIMCKLVSCTLT